MVYRPREEAVKNCGNHNTKFLHKNSNATIHNSAVYNLMSIIGGPSASKIGENTDIKYLQHVLQHAN